MTGYSQPPDPDNDPVEAEKAAAQPMQPETPAETREAADDDSSRDRNESPAGNETP
jgi:hypothetical protein